MSLTVPLACVGIFETRIANTPKYLKIICLNLMKILTINTAPYGSVARIAMETAELAEKNGIEDRLSFGYSYHPIKSKYTRYHSGNIVSSIIDMVLCRLTGLMGTFSWIHTRLYLRKIKRYDPDIIHLHNLHGCMNLGLITDYIRESGKPVVWTFHDCWAFTGHCVHYDFINCTKWKTLCHHCPLYKDFPKAFVDNSRCMHKKKKKWFSNLGRVVLVAPSHWMSKQLEMSYLSQYPIKVIQNGINLDIFKISESTFKQRHSIDDKFVLLGVAFGWGEKKGLDTFAKLSEELDDEYRIVLVGTNEESDKHLPPSVISIHATQNQAELADIYNGADLFVNLTREDTFPTVNIEALACGTPVITFNTGGSPEIIDETCGHVVEKEDLPTLVKLIRDVKENRPFEAQACRKRAELFNKDDRFMDYINLYKSLYDEQAR